MSTAGGRFVSYSAFPQPYRIDHYLTCGELPFFAASAIRGVGTKHISRHATLAEAKIACERHLEEQSQAESNDEGRFNTQGDPIR